MLGSEMGILETAACLPSNHLAICHNLPLSESLTGALNPGQVEIELQTNEEKRERVMESAPTRGRE